MEANDIDACDFLLRASAFYALSALAIVFVILEHLISGRKGMPCIPPEAFAILLIPGFNILPFIVCFLIFAHTVFTMTVEYCEKKHVAASTERAFRRSRRNAWRFFIRKFID